MKKRSTAMYGISRVDDEVYRAHMWRVSLRRRGKMHVKNFPDKTLGGKRDALAAAKRYRDAVLERHPPLTRKEFSSAKRSNNNSGITGVYTYAKKYRLADSREMETWYWEAHWPTQPGESKSARFSVREYGEERARQLAIEAREQGMAKIKGVFWASERSEEIIANQQPTAYGAKNTAITAAKPSQEIPRRKALNPFWLPFVLLPPFVSATNE